MLLARKSFDRLFSKDRRMVLDKGEFLAFHGWGKDAGWWWGTTLRRGVQRIRLADHTRMTQLDPGHITTWPKAMKRLVPLLTSRTWSGGWKRAAVVLGAKMRPGLAEIPPAVRRAINSPFTPARFRGLDGLNICWSLDYIPKDAFEWYMASYWLNHYPQVRTQGRLSEAQYWTPKATKQVQRQFQDVLRAPRALIIGVAYREADAETCKAIAKWLSRRQRWGSESFELTVPALADHLRRWTQTMGTRPTPVQLTRVSQLLRPGEHNDEQMQELTRVIARLLTCPRLVGDAFARNWDSVEYLATRPQVEFLRRVRDWTSLDVVHGEMIAAARREYQAWRNVHLGGNPTDRWAEVEDKTMAPYRPLLPGITQLVTEEEFQVEGDRMHHCVGGYYGDSRRGRATFYHVEAQGEKATLQLHEDGTIGQLYGPCNKQVSATIRSLVETWLTQS